MTILLAIIVLLLLAGHAYVAWRVVRPLLRLSRHADALTRGDMTALDQPIGGIGPVRSLGRAMAGMAGHVRRAQAQSRALAGQIASGQETERQRIARELHDDTLQRFVALGQSVDMAREWLRSDPRRAEATLQTAREGAVEGASALRTLIGDLRPPALSELGLVTALAVHAARFKDISVKVDVSGTARRLDETRELALFRAAQEALTNARRHAEAQKVHIIVHYEADGVLLRVSDNGKGFRPPADLNELALDRHYGLIGMQERLSQLGGTLKLVSQPGAGTTLEVHFPTVPADQPPGLVRDPVCSALIESAAAYGSVEHAGTTYYFCCPVCMGAFQKDPALYLGA
jgi:signal transduction histidine kinase/YHS domain-containing protein